MIEQWRSWHLDVLALYTHMSWRSYVVYFKQKQTSGSNTPSSCGVLHICSVTAGTPCRDYVFCAMKPWLVGGLRGNVGPCCFKTSWWFATSGFGRKKGFVQRWWQKLNTCQGVVFMHSSFRSLLGIAFDVLAQGGLSQPVMVSLWLLRVLDQSTWQWNLVQKTCMKTYSCLKPSRGWINYQWLFFFWVPGCGRDTSRIFADMEQKFLSATWCGA